MTDHVIARHPDGIVGLMLVLPTATPPDAATRHENVVRMRKLAPHIRRFVTVPIGDALHVMVVRTVMRALGVVQGKSRVQKVANTIEQGIRSLLEAASPLTPTPAEIEADLRAMYEALNVNPQTHMPNA
jgi:hypothetical protein